MPSKNMQDCIDKCANCAKFCLETIAYCIKTGGKHTEPRHLGMMLDCAAVCETSTKLMINGSEFQNRHCELCAEICDHCAEDCAKFGDARMDACAETCRTCAEACREMSSSRQAA